MAGLRRFRRACAGQATRQIRRTERIPRRRGVHHLLDLLRRDFKHFPVATDQTSFSAALEYHFRRADLRVRFKHRITVFEMEQRLLVVNRQQRQIDRIGAAAGVVKQSRTAASLRQ